MVREGAKVAGERVKVKSKGKGVMRMTAVSLYTSTQPGIGGYKIESRCEINVRIQKIDVIIVFLYLCPFKSS
jgi:hypothetical protein